MNQPPKKVLFLITKATWGGAQRYVFDLATHLPREQFNVSVAYGTGGRLLTMLKEKNVPTHSVPFLGRDVALFSDIASFFQLVRVLRAVQPYVLHVNSSKAAALGALAGRLCGVPKIIFTVHGWPFKEGRNFLLRAIIYLISWFTTLLSHATIVVSKTDEKIGQRTPFLKKKIQYIPLGIEMLTFLSREEASAALSISTNAPRIVSIGELTKNKGYQFAIDAIVELKERGVAVEYFVFSDGELRGELERQARERGVTEHIHFLGFVENASKYLKAFDIFLLPSIKEGTPYVLLEAEIAGLQIVATDVIDNFWTASGIVTLVPPANAAGLVEGIERSIGLPVDAGVQPFSTLDRMVKRTSALY